MASQTFTLTAGEDNITGTSGNDSFDAPVINVGGTLTQTLQAVDQINGGAGTDTLNATLNSGTTVTPVLNSVENVSIRSVANGSGINLSAATGVEKVTVTTSTGSAVVAGLGAVGSLAVSNQTAAVTVSDSTATSLNFAFDSYGTKDTASEITVNGVATSATITATDSNVDILSLTTVKALTVATTGTNKVGAASDGTIETLNVSGSGSFEFDGNLTALKTLSSTAAGAVKVTGLGAAFETATTGAGNDSITVATATGVKNINTGAGNDSVNISGALGAAAVVDLGAGDDTLILNTTPTAGVTLTGGAGRDTLQTSQTIFADVVAFTDQQKAKISGFEVLSISNALTNGSTVNVGAISGITNFVAAAGVVTGGTANVTNLGAGASVEIAGGNSAAVVGVDEEQSIDFTGTVVGAAGAGDITVGGITVALDNDDTADIIAGKVAAALNNQPLTTPNTGATVVTATANGAVVTVVFPNSLGNVGAISVANVDAAFTAGLQADVVEEVAGVAAVAGVGGGTLVLSQATDTAADSLSLKLNNNYTENNDATSTITALTNTVTASKVETLNVESTGKASTAFLANEGTKADGVNNTLMLTNNDLVTLNVTGNQAFTFSSAAAMAKLATIDASALSAGATIDASAHVADSAALTIRGSATAANSLTGGATADVIVGGSAADVITSSGKADTITLGGGNDTYVLASAAHSVVNARDVITDFAANTVGQGTNGAATTAGAAAGNLRNGDVIDLSLFNKAQVNVAVFQNAADSITFLQNSAGTAGLAGSPAGLDQINVALDASTGTLYVDGTDNGIADSVITLTGMSTINAAAFVVA